MTADRPLLLDTSVVVHLVRGNATGQRMNTEFGLQTRSERPLISVVTVGELRTFGIRLGWGESKLKKLDDIVSELTVVDIHNTTVLDHYAKIDAFARSKGRSLSDNDTWIAATTAAAGALLLTNDKDFDALHPELIERIYVSPTPPPAP